MHGLKRLILMMVVILGKFSISQLLFLNELLCVMLEVNVI